MITKSELPKKPPFYTALQLEPNKLLDRGQYSDALSTMTSIAKLNPGFIGFSNDDIDTNDTIIVIYFNRYESLKEWVEEARDLIPYSVKIDDIVEETGCLWQWLESPVTITDKTTIVNAA